MFQASSPKTVYDFTAKDIDGNEVSLEKYRYVKYLSHNYTLEYMMWNKSNVVL